MGKTDGRDRASRFGDRVTVEAQNPTPRIRVVIADDHALVRAGLRVLLEAEMDLEVVGEVTDGVSALGLVENWAPQVLVLDAILPVLSGIDVARRLLAAHSPTRPLFLSAYDDERYVRDALAAGAAGYLLKRDANVDVVEAVRGVVRGETGWFSREIMGKVLEHGRLEGGQELSGTEPLSRRELQVLELLADGLTNGGIADSLCLSEGTVRNHVLSVYGKLGVHSRAEACAWAWRCGIVKRTEVGKS